MRGRGTAFVAGLVAAGGALGAAYGSGARGGAGDLVVAQFPARVAPASGDTSATLRSGLGEGGRIVLVSPGGRVTRLTAGFESAADPDVSFDGKRILFAGRRTAGDPWCVYEMRADGTDARQITYLGAA